MSLWDSRGVTLIEIMVSVMFLLITITGFITTYTNLNVQAVRMRQKRMAIRLAQKELEKCLADPQIFSECNYSTIEKNIILDEQRNISGILKTELDPPNNTIECKIIWADGNISLKTRRN